MTGRAFKSFIPFLLALLLAGGFVLYLLNTKEEPRKSTPDVELLRKYDSLQSALETTTKQRDGAYNTIDSIHLSRKADSILIQKLNKQLNEIRGSYREVPRDSLGTIMDRRADNARQIN